MALGLIWKPKGVGSQDALGLLKTELNLDTKGRQGMGHTGILDPFAEGLLLCGTEEGTKLLAPLTGLDKVYETTLCFGRSSDTLDDTGEFMDPQGEEAARVSAWLSRPDSEIDSDLKSFLVSVTESQFDQVPPHFSAVHIDGKRSYEWARQGIQKELKSKTVNVFETQHLGVRRDPEGCILWDFRLRVSSGTYIRALARDWGLELCGFPGHLTRLVRTAVGPFGEGVFESKSIPVEHPFWKPLALEDFKVFFDIHYLSEFEAELLRKNGRWAPEPHPQARLLVGPNSIGTVAWTEAGSGKIGRVFTADPF